MYQLKGKKLKNEKIYGKKKGFRKCAKTNTLELTCLEKDKRTSVPAKVEIWCGRLGLVFDSLHHRIPRKSILCRNFPNYQNLWLFPLSKYRELIWENYYFRYRSPSEAMEVERWKIGKLHCLRTSTWYKERWRTETEIKRWVG